MNKTELVNAMAAKTGMTKVAAKQAMTACFDSIQDWFSAHTKDEIVKIPVVIAHYKKYKWVKNIINEEV